MNELWTFDLIIQSVTLFSITIVTPMFEQNNLDYHPISVSVQGFQQLEILASTVLLTTVLIIEQIIEQVIPLNQKITSFIINFLTST